jgi:Xaa-Pro aminopeptidase
MHTDFFGGLAPRVNDGSIHQLRRKDLIEAIKQKHGNDVTGIVVLFAAFEAGIERFKQDKTFYYYTGINEPGSAIVIDIQGASTLYLANCLEKRAQWMVLPEAIVQKNTKALYVDAIELLGDECAGYTLDSYFSREEYAHLIERIEKAQCAGESLFVAYPDNGYECLQQRFVLNHIQKFIPDLQNSFVDISKLIARGRRRKDLGEIEAIYRAVEVTELAHESAVRVIKNDVAEAEVQASLEYMMIASNARPSFPSIVASGHNGTILHYSENSGTLKDGDLVVIDIGAELHHYCADLTRTYPVSGAFTKRQKELYSIVLETQNYCADLAKPGMWLKNKDKADQSLHHLAQKFLQKRGYDKYFPHGIGHFLGLDVHDVGDYNEPLQEGDVITIEPGIYIPQEGIGIRIEDNYWITKDGVICLSENLPKEADEIEAFVQQALSDDADDDEEEGGDGYEDDEEYEDEFN